MQEIKGRIPLSLSLFPHSLDSKKLFGNSRLLLSAITAARARSREAIPIYYFPDCGIRLDSSLRRIYIRIRGKYKKDEKKERGEGGGERGFDTVNKLWKSYLSAAAASLLLLSSRVIYRKASGLCISMLSHARNKYFKRERFVHFVPGPISARAPQS